MIQFFSAKRLPKLHGEQVILDDPMHAVKWGSGV